jgi:hypothetical protein
VSITQALIDIITALSTNNFSAALKLHDELKEIAAHLSLYLRDTMD